MQAIKTHELTVETLKEQLHYCPETGSWTWLKGRGRKVKRDAGCFSTNGRKYIKINQQPYLAARLAWFYMTGKWPTYEIDHINRNKSDDRWSNLRDVTHKKNFENTHIRNNKVNGKFEAYDSN